MLFHVITLICTVVISVDALWPARLFAGFHAQDSAEPCAKIPQHLLFNYKKNLLTQSGLNHVETALAANVIRTIQFFRKTSTSQVLFADDQQCGALIEEAHSKELAQMFKREKQGRYKSDLCRLAQLYLHGGYYFDNDLQPTTDFHAIMPSCTGLITVTSAQGGIFQAFLGAVPGHAALKLAMNMTLQYYRGDRKVTGTVGTSIMKKALQEFTGRDMISAGASEGIFLLEERAPERKRFMSNFGDCNYAVWHERELVFYSRFLDTLMKGTCTHAEVWSWYLPSSLQTRFGKMLDHIQLFFSRGAPS